MQDVSGGVPVAVEGTAWPLFGMEVDVKQARDEIKVKPRARHTAVIYIPVVLKCSGGRRQCPNTQTCKACFDCMTPVTCHS